MSFHLVVLNNMKFQKEILKEMNFLFNATKAACLDV